MIIYYAAPKRFRNGVLFIGSLIFYAWGEPVYMGLLLFSTAVDFFLGKMTSRFTGQGNRRKAQCMVAASALINLGLLFFFKYAVFLASSTNLMAGTDWSVPQLVLPLGISFYTFQTMSYTIDIYRGKAQVQTDLIAFGAYVSMFPQLVAGPIVRYHTIAGELRGRRESYGQFADGICRFMAGLGKKVLLANPMGALWTEVQGVLQREQTVLMVWMALAAFGLQIYFDFSGYSDMAIGLGKMLGFHLPENFRYPYTASSITDFWRRWHMTLGEWFREYIYIPLGGNRRGRIRQGLYLLLVWCLTGIWHGAGWNFLLWGLYYGVLLILEKFWLGDWLNRYAMKGTGVTGDCVSHVYTLILVFMGWVLFAHEDIGTAGRFYGKMLGIGVQWQANGRTLYLLKNYMPLLAVCIIGATDLPFRWWKKKTRSFCMILAGVIAVLLLSVAFLVNADYNPFLYFRF